MADVPLRHRVTMLSILSLLGLLSRVAAFDKQQNTSPSQGNCYSCTATEAGSNCERNPISVDNGVLSCNRESRTCTIVRVEEWPSRRVKSFYRGCDGRTRVFERNHCIVEKDERTCFTACDGDLCNASDGLDADREFLRYDSVVPPVSSAAGSSSIGCKRVFNTVNAVLMTFPLWVM